MKTEIIYVMRVEKNLKPMTAMVDYGGGPEKESDLSFFLLESETGKKIILSGSGRAEDYGHGYINSGCMVVQNQNRRQPEKTYKILKTCYGSDALPTLGKGTYPWYVMK